MGEIIQLPVKKVSKPRRQRTRVLAAIPLPDDKSGAELSWLRQEEIEQDEEALGQVLARLVHRSGHVHQAEHHRLAGGHRHAHAAAVAQVDRVEVGDALQPRPQRGDLALEFRNLVSERVRLRMALDGF